MITIKDIVELAKAGYKPNEVKELIELSKNEENNSTIISGSSDDAGEMDNPPSNIVQDSTPIHSFTELSPAEETEKDDTDYKALYEASQLELKEAQKANIKRDISSEEDNKSDEDILKDLIKEFI